MKYYRNRKPSRRRCTTESRSNSKGYSRPFSLVGQCPLCPCHRENQSWEMNEPNSIE
jgi:hypothetical protein